MILRCCGESAILEPFSGRRSSDDAHNRMAGQTPMAYYTVPVKSQLSNDEFLREHVLKMQPVLIKNALNDWKAISWSKDYLKARAGQHLITYRTEGKDATDRFGDLLDLVFDPSKQAPYLRNIDVGRQLPTLLADISPEPIYSRSNWRSHPLMPSAWPREVRKNLYELFISRANASFPYLHIDYWGMSGFLAQLYGEKEVILFPIEDARYLYTKPDSPRVSTITDFDNPDYDKFPVFRQAHQYRVRLRAGDLLYNPSWWHTTKTISTSMTLIWAYWNRHEWRNLVAEVRGSGGAKGRLAVVPYLQFVGMCNRVKG